MQFVRADAANVTAIVQQSDEQSGTLRQRAVGRIAALMSPHAALKSAILSCAANAGEDTWTARALIATALVSSIRRGGRGRLVLSADRRTNAQGRRALIALADTLKALLRDNCVSIAVSFA